MSKSNKLNIHPTAIVHPKAEISPDVEIGPYSSIGAKVVLGEGVNVGASCVIEGRTTIGKNCRIFTGAVIGSEPQDLKYSNEETRLTIGENNTIREYVTINPGTGEGGETRIGDTNLLMAYSHVAHDCSVGNSVVIANVGTLAGHVTIEDGAIIGGLVAIHQFTRIGTLAIIGGCSKVVQDVPPYSRCDGHPAKVYGLNRIGLERAGVAKESAVSLKRAFKLLFNSGLSTSHALEKIKEEVPQTKEVAHLMEFIRKSERGVCTWPK